MSSSYKSYKDSRSRKPYDRNDGKYRDQDRLKGNRNKRRRRVIPDRLKERTERFRIKSSRSIADVIKFCDLTNKDLQNTPIAQPERMRDAGYCKKELIESLWEQKNRMDKVFDEGNANVYYKVRDELFPQDKKGSKTFWNRAGDKLYQVHKEVDILKYKGCRFLDVCGGPGAFSQVVMEVSQAKEGFGITLVTKDTPKSELWYKNLLEESKFTAIYGVDETGNVYKPENLEFLKEKIGKEGVKIVVADGGFEIKKNDKDEHMENYQELFSARVIMSEFLAMIKVIQEDGHFVCKLFDTFSHITNSLIYLLTLIFEKVYIVKPIRSRIVNSERYVVGKYMIAKEDELQQLHDHLAALHKACEDDKYPVSIFPIEVMTEDKEFMETMTTMCEEICEKQTDVLKIVMDEVYEDIEEKEDGKD